MPSLEVRARDYFFAHFVVGAAKTYDFLEPYYAKTPSNSHLLSSIDAASLAYLFVLTQSGLVLSNAKERYGLAMAKTREALASPSATTNDVTVVATVLLDMYEKMLNHKPLATKAWCSHIKGTLALAKIRGNEQFQDPAMFRILSRFSTKYLISCIVTFNAAPEEFQAFRQQLEAVQDALTPKWQLSTILIDFASLRADIKGRRLGHVAIVGKAANLDRRLRELSQNTPSSWHYETVFSMNSPRVYNSHYHVYVDHHVTQMWNTLRLVRILLNEMIIENQTTKVQETSPSPDFSHNPAENIIQLASEISASVPQYVGVLFEHSRISSTASLQNPGPITASVLNMASRTSKGHSFSPDTLSILLLQCYTLLFPLYVAGRSKYISPDIKAWVIQELHCIGSDMRVRNAEFVARLLEDGVGGSDLDPFVVYTRLGSYAFLA